MFRPQFTGLIASLACLGTVVASAPAVTVFDFEDQAATFITPPDVNRTGALTSLDLVKDGLTLTLTRGSSKGFDIVSNTGSQANKPDSWGARSLDPFFAESETDAFFGTFSAPVNSVNIEFGDYGADDDSFFMEVFDGPDGTGSLLGSNTVTYGTSSLPIFGTGNITATGIRSVRFHGGSSSFQHSIFYDNISVTPSDNAVPEPGSMALVVGALPLLGFLRRRVR